MATTIRAGVVGVGYLGRFHAEKYAAMDNVTLAGVVDSRPDRARDTGRVFGVPAFCDYRDLFGKVDAVSVVTPTPLHYEVGEAFLSRGVDVLMEKPIAVTLEQADALVRLADEKGSILQVGHLERFNPAIKAAMEKVRHPLFIESSRLSLYKERGTDVSVVLDLMIHDIDLIFHFVHSGIKYCHAMGAPVVSDTVDIANAHIEFNNGTVAKVSASRIASKNERKIRLFQKDGYISVDFANRSIVHVRPIAGASNCPIPGMTMEEERFSEGDALADEIASFINCVITRQKPVVSGAMGRDALAVALNILQQIRESTSRIQE